jgi:hypothetical protein
MCCGAYVIMVLGTIVPVGPGAHIVPLFVLCSRLFGVGLSFMSHPSIDRVVVSTSLAVLAAGRWCQMNDITTSPIYYSAQDLKRLEAMAQRHVFEHGYNARRVGWLMRECPPFLIDKWKLWWRQGWRKRRDEDIERRSKPGCFKE